MKIAYEKALYIMGSGKSEDSWVNVAKTLKRMCNSSLIRVNFHLLKKNRICNTQFRTYEHFLRHRSQSMKNSVPLSKFFIDHSDILLGYGSSRGRTWVACLLILSADTFLVQSQLISVYPDQIKEKKMQVVLILMAKMK